MNSKVSRITSETLVFSTKNFNKKFMEDDPNYIQSNPIYNSTIDSDINLSISEDENKTINQQLKNTKINDDPIDHTFNFHYPIIFYTKYDYVFKFCGNYSKKEMLQNTLKIRSYPHHYKSTLFLYEKNSLIRKKDFSFLKINFNEIKKKGNKLYKKRKFREALENYIEAYSLLKWLEFKNKKNYNQYIQSQLPILDKDIIECSSLPLINDDESENNLNELLIRILLCLSSTFMELRHYKCALNCLNEILCIDENNTSALLRRSQCYLYNKESNEDDYNLALKDINNAFSIFSEFKIQIPLIFTEHYDKIINLMKKKKEFEKKQLKIFFLNAFNSFLKYPYKESWNNYDRNSRIQDIQFNVLKIMKRTYKFIIKYYTEANNITQLTIAKREIENFMEKYEKFRYFHFMNIQKFISIIEEENKNNNFLTKEMKEYIHIKMFHNFLEYFKNKKADSIFQEGNFNINLIKYAINKVNKEIKNKENESESYSSQYETIDEDNNKNGKKIILPENLSLIVSFGLIISSLIYMFLALFFFLPNQTLHNDN